MALNAQQVASLNALNQKIAGGYKPNATENQGYTYNPVPQGATKISNPSGLQGLNESQIFRQGKDIYKLPTVNPVPQGATKISNPSGLQGLNESQIFRQGKDIYKLPTVSKTLTSDQVTGSIPDVQATNQAENYLPNYVSGQNKYMEMVMGDLSTAQEDIRKQEELATTTQSKLGDLYEQAGMKGTEYTSELEKYNYGANVTQLQEINRQIASKNAEFEQAINAQEGRVASAGSIYGRQALIQRQQASQIGALSSMAQALQGNITLAQQTAKDALDIKYSSIENEIEQTKSQIESIYEQLDRADKKKADAQLLALNERTRVLEEQKANDEQINQVMLSAAQNGATVDTLNKIMNSKTLGEAIINSGEYIRTATTGNWEQYTNPQTGENMSFNRDTGEYKLMGSGNLGEPVGEISGLPAYDTRTANPGVNRSDRNNNPGNIKISDYTKTFDGVIGVESNQAQDGGNFIIFDSPESGINAIGQLLLTGKSYQGVTAEQAIKKYNGGGSYGAASLGLIPKGDFQAQIADPARLKYVAKAIAEAEGFTGNSGKTTTATNVTEDGYDVSKFTPEFYSSTYGQKVLNNEQQYYTNFLSQPAVKTFIENQTKAGSIQAIVDSGVGGPEDLALVFEFMKALDPTSVVRESEYDTASKAGNPFKQVAAKMGGYVSKGQILPEDVKQSFIKLANIKLEEQRKIYDVIRSEARKTAYQQGLNPENVAPDLTITEISQSASPESAWLQQQGLSTQPTQATEEPKSSAWNWFRGLFGAKPQPNSADIAKSFLK